MNDEILLRLEEIFPEMVQMRRELHMYPELSFHETNTPKKIAKYLTELGLEVKTEVGGRGVTGLLRGSKPGKTVALRADFDALPIQDEKEVDYKSRIPGVMHACGHDVHTAALLAVARVLQESKEQLEGNILFIHQFAEEVIPGGAKFMIEDGCLKGVDAIFGAHVSSTDPIGTLGVREGAAMANGDIFEIEIQGKGGHGATPHLTVDSISIGSQVVVNLQQIVSRKVDPINPAVVTVGTFNSGTSFNVIPDKAKITGTVRTFDEYTRQLIEKALEELVHTSCQGNGAQADFKYTRGYPALINHSKEMKRVEKVGKKLFGPENVQRINPQMGMEDFSYYLKEIPGAFFWVGGGNPELIEQHPHHHPKFDVDERAILSISKLFVSVVFDYLSEKGKEQIKVLQTNV